MRSLSAFLAAAVLCLCAARNASAAYGGARTAHTTSLLPTGNVLVVGGIDASGTFLNTTVLGLTAKDGSISAGPSITVARASHTATVMGNGCVLIAGGVNGGGVLSDARVYDPIANTMSTPGSSMSTARFNHTATLLNDGRVLLCGGQSDTSGTVSQTCDLFTPTGTMGPGTCSGSFTGSVSMLHPRTVHTAVLLQDGKVWLAGGWDGSGYTPTTEKYIPATAPGVGSFSSASPMIQARSNHTATMMGDGRILVAGGVDGQNLLENRGILDTLEIYDPVANNTIPGPVLEARRQQHTATLMEDGTVFLFGGLGNITTTYFTPTPALIFGGNAAPPRAAKININGGVVTPGVPAPNIDLNFTLGTDVSGTINDGTVLYSQPTMDKPSWGTIAIPDPLVVNLQGSPVSCGNLAAGGSCNVTITPFSLPGFSATATFSSVPTTLSATANGGVVNTSGTNLAGGSDATFGTTAASGITGLDGASLTGSINVSAGTITSQSYTITLTGGTLPFNNVTDNNGSMTLLSPNDLTGLTGTIAYTTIQNLAMSDASLTGGVLNFTPTPLNSSNTSGSLTGGSNATFNLVINLPLDLANSTISGTYAITGGSIAGSTYTVSLSGGNISFSNVLVDAAGKLSVNGASATSLAGAITYPTGGTQPANSGDPDPQGLLKTVSGTLNYTATGLHLTGAAMSLTSSIVFTAATGVSISGANLKVNTSTAIVRGMVFGQGEFYNPGTNSVYFEPPAPPGASVYADPSVETFGQTATLLPSSDMLLVGGSDCSSAACTSLTAINRGINYLDGQPSNTYVATSGNLNSARALHTATLLSDGTILVAGGTNGLNLLSSAEIFTPGSTPGIGQFARTTNDMSNPRDLHTATLMTNGRVLIAGGISTNALSTGSISAVDIYYPDTKLFLPTTPMAAARSNHTATLMPDGKVMVVGGFGAGDVITGTAEVFDPEHLTWTTVAPLPGAATAALHTATLLKDGRLMIAGGVSASGVLNTVFAYNPGSGTWSTLAPMPSKLRSHTATLLLDGRVLVAGGDDGNGETTSSYIYDPVANTWTPATSPTTTPIAAARFGHTATLLPDGNVMISGGTNKFGAIPPFSEVYHVDGSSWVTGVPFTGGNRTNHTMTLAPNGRIYAIGGSNGTIGGNGTTLYNTAVEGAFDITPDLDGKNQPVGGSLRQSSFTITSVTPLQNSEVLNLAGSKLLGGTEAGGGGSASANSSFAIPHLILQKTDASDFILDLTTYVFSGATPPTNAAMTATLPSAQAAMPSGWYNARVGVNGVYSNATFVQVGPAKPASAPTGLTGTAQGISSITWTWGAVGGVDGYDIYSDSTGVFIATVAANSYVQTGIAPNTSLKIRVAGYTLSGDGPAAVSPLTAVSPITVINSVSCGPSSPSGDTTASIPWTWTLVPSAQTYNVYNATTGAIITVTTVPNFYDVGLGTNTQRTLQISAVSAGIEGALSAPTTCYTLAAAPLAPLVSQNLPVMDASTGTVTLNWIANGNPAGTVYKATLNSQDPNFVPLTNGTTALQIVFGSLKPSTQFGAQIVALNGANTASAPLPAVPVSTYTLPAPPKTVSVTATTPVSISIAWDQNNNSPFTNYQVLVSTDVGFTGSISTAVAFSAQYTGSTFTVQGLITGLQYFISVAAQNQLGQVSVAVATNAVTNNGGAPIGSLAGLIPAEGASGFSGTIGSISVFRTIELRSSGGSFLQDTTVTVSTYSLLDPGHIACTNAVPGVGGAGMAVSITNAPELQPVRPLYFSGTYSAAEAATFPVPVSQLTLARYEPTSGTCVPLPTVFNPTTKTFVAELNHFSLYQVVAVPLATTADTARIFPNPYRAATDGFITIDQVPPSARVRVFTLRGEKILDAVADGTGRVTWSADNTAGRPVASGLYLVEVESGGTKKILKLVVIR